MKQLLSFAVALVFSIFLIIPGHAASTEEQDAAELLYQLGLFQGKGTDANGNPLYALDDFPTRQEAVTMLVRLLGKENEALAGTWEMPFTDVDDWAKPYVGYAYTEGITVGTGKTTFGGKTMVTVSQYLTFVLRVLGYDSDIDFKWDAAWELSDKIGMTDGSYNANTKKFCRGDLAIISMWGLVTEMKDSSASLYDVLVFTGAIEVNDQITEKLLGIKALKSDNITESRNTQAVKTAKEIESIYATVYPNMVKKMLIEDYGYTETQAIYAIQNAGIAWDMYAVLQAENYYWLNNGLLNKGDVDYYLSIELGYMQDTVDYALKVNASMFESLSAVGTYIFGEETIWFYSDGSLMLNSIDTGITNPGEHFTLTGTWTQTDNIVVCRLFDNTGFEWEPVTATLSTNGIEFWGNFYSKTGSSVPIPSEENRLQNSNSNQSNNSGTLVVIPKQEETSGHLVWVPTNGGTKYHSKASCSKMKDPIQVSIETAKAHGYTACERCN